MTIPGPTGTLTGPPGGSGAASERPGTRPATKLALFDLDHTLLSGDSDVLWCEFLMQRGVLDRAAFEPRNADMARRYADASVSVQDFCDFYVGTLAGRSPEQWQRLCDQFLSEVVAPRVPVSAHTLVDEHRRQDHMLVLTTATNRVITGMTAKYLGIDHLIATEVELEGGVCTGRTRGTLNMREGKVTRLHDWLAEHGLPVTLLAQATLYSDSSNDLPLLGAVGEPVAVDPDARLRAHASAAGWRVLTLAR